MSASEQQADASQATPANPANQATQDSPAEHLKKREEFTEQLYTYLQKSPSMTADDPIEKRGLNQIQIDYIIDILVNSKNKEKNYYKLK